jgi:hypothetical protein
MFLFCIQTDKSGAGITLLIQRRSGFNSRQGQETFLLYTAPRPALGPTHPLIQGVPWILSSKLKRLGCEVDLSPLSVPSPRMTELSIHSPMCLHVVAFRYLSTGRKLFYSRPRNKFWMHLNNIQRNFLGTR